MTIKRVSVLLAVLLLSACASPSTQPGELTPHINTTYGFRVDYPSNWDVSVDPISLVGSTPGKVHAVAFASLEAGAIFVVYVQDLDRQETLSEYAARQMDNIRSTAGDMQITEPVPTTLGGLDAFVTEATLAQNGQTLRQRTVLAVKGMRGYAVSAAAPVESQLQVVLDDMLASFGFMP